MRSGLRRNLTSLFEAAGYVIPAAGRQASKMLAYDLFNTAVKYSGPVEKARLESVKATLEKAGYDVDTDRPYKDVLGLKDGKAAFDKLLHP